jgi:NAD(P)-dependent dehydrogenase (short-subunit alcohol dehydrogenase family)
MAIEPGSILLTGRAAVVTGAAAGIGKAVALALARFGADVAICDRDAENLMGTADQATSLGRRVVTGVIDVREADAVTGFLDQVARELGRVDVLVNNAGGGFRSPFMDVSAKGESALVRENFTSVGLFVRGVVPLVPPSGGSVVNITSIEAHRAGPGYGVYSAMKAAVSNLTKTLALELGDRMIRVKCIAPDVIPTPGIGNVVTTPTPLARRGDVDDVAGAAVVLASDLSGFVTGSTIHVDGGNLAAAGWRRDESGGFATT